ncbi:hypothetical protein MATL_G00198470 [Megalops atlanticus]|uniref:C-type lectin domain-containing protein n=1 Tax=Megalops atlanticus TaxID=7932 RepID=A0A9D3SZF5_MEGAT|nr:hypothetical protein MATL_G00198470 [Megalops atlanticus]
MKTAIVLVVLFAWVSVSATETETEDSGLAVDVSEYCASNFPQRCRRRGTWYRVGNHCLGYFRGPLNFTDAEFRCRKEVHGGHLVSVHSYHDNVQLLCIIMKHNHGHPRIWMGGMEMFRSKKFIWTDGSPWNYKAWVPGQPDNTNNVEDCVEMNWSYAGKWNDNACSRRKSYVCSFKA